MATINISLVTTPFTTASKYSTIAKLLELFVSMIHSIRPVSSYGSYHRYPMRRICIRAPVVWLAGIWMNPRWYAKPGSMVLSSLGIFMFMRGQTLMCREINMNSISLIQFRLLSAILQEFVRNWIITVLHQTIDFILIRIKVYCH